MKKVIIALVLSLVLVFGVVGFAGAITDGELDGDGHPYVGLMVADAGPGQPAWRCSGTLIAPDVFLTAGHCTDGAYAARVWFNADMTYDSVPFPLYPYGGPGSGAIEGTPYTHPDYNPNAFFFRDVGVVILDQPVNLDEYGVLPQLNQLDSFKTRRGLQDVTFTAVGYGLQMSFPDAASWKENNVRVRMVANPKLNQINVPGFTGDFSLLLSNNHSTGGTCFGDSGGPNFIDGTNVVGGVTSFGINGNCAGTGGVFRMDRSWSLDWVSTFLGN
ncbi:MAG: trypsin-like serine protease [Chloroflexota bacterium]|nr:MAG: trypsin-like serine protease [Chloroflexota bacterium]